MVLTYGVALMSCSSGLKANAFGDRSSGDSPDETDLVLGRVWNEGGTGVLNTLSLSQYTLSITGEIVIGLVFGWVHCSEAFLWLLSSHLRYSVGNFSRKLCVLWLHRPLSFSAYHHGIFLTLKLFIWYKWELLPMKQEERSQSTTLAIHLNI